MGRNNKNKKSKAKQKAKQQRVAEAHFNEVEEQFFAAGAAYESGELAAAEITSEEPSRPSLLERLLFRHRVVT